MNEKKKMPVISVIFILLGVGLILFGIISPQVKFGGKNSFTIESDRRVDYTKYKAEIKTSETLDLASGVFEINNEDYQVELTISDDDDYQYEFEVVVDYEWGTNRLDEDYEFKAKNTAGKEIVFKYNDGFMSNGLKLFSTIAPIMFGVVMLLAGVASVFVVSKGAVSTTLVGTPDGSDTGLVGSVKDRIGGPQPKPCEYCGCDNNPGEIKCTSCGAPLKKK